MPTLARKSRTTSPELTRKTEPVARDVLVERPTIDAQALTSDVLTLFNTTADASSLPVVDLATGKPIGIINRLQFMSSLAKPFYKEIFLKRSCLAFMDKNPLVVEEGMPLPELSILMANGENNVLADGFVIVADDCYQGMGYAQDVLSILSEVYQQKSVTVTQHRDQLEAEVLRRTQELVEARDDALAAARAERSFLANMSHEIRTPMNAIIGMTYLMARDGLPDKQADRLAKIDLSAKHLLAIINDILDLSKIGAGKLTLVEEPVNLADLIFGVADMLGPVAHNKGLRLIIEPSTPTGLLYGDSTRLTQALMNYVSNAVKFTERGDVILRYRRLHTDHDGIVVRFEVQDSGIGIAADVLQTLFSAFRQADSTTTRKHGGTGLGLAITRHLAEMIGGSAGAESTPRQGSLFWFTARLRLVPPQRGEACRPAAPHRSAVEGDEAMRLLHSCHAGAQVLVVEDDPLNQEITSGLLAQAGLIFEIAATGRAAVNRATSCSFDLVLMDMQMPEMGGIEATQQIRALPAYANTPILAMTASAFKEDEQACAEAGMNDFIAKPVNVDVFYRTLLKWLPERTMNSQT